MRESGLCRSTITRRRAKSGLVAVFALILLACVLVTVLSVSSEVGLNQRMASNENDIAQAELVASAGVETALHWAAVTQTWRAVAAPLGPAVPLCASVPFAGGTFTVYVYDPVDQTRIQEPARAVAIRSVGQYRGVTRTLCVQAAPPIQEAATYAVFTDSGVSLSGGVSVNGNVRSNGSVTGSSTEPIIGNIYVPPEAIVSPGLLDADTQRVTVNAAALPAPDVQWFVQRASRVNASTLSKVVLSPTSNPYGLTNSDGLYYIDAGGSAVSLSDLYLRGSLVIVNTPRTTFRGGLVVRPVRADYPAIMDACANGPQFRLDYSMSEILDNVDYNQDGDKVDLFRCEVNGICYSSALVSGLTASSVPSLPVTVNGAIICPSLSLSGTNVAINHDPALLSNPVVGFIGPGLVRKRGSMVQY